MLRFFSNQGLQAAAVIAMLTCLGSTRADLIPVQNASFEDPPQAVDSFTRFATDWDSSNAGVVRSSSIQAADGLQFGYAGNGQPGFLFQDLGIPVQTGLVYQLDVSVATQGLDIPANYLIELTAGGTPFGQLAGVLLNSPFQQFSLVAAGSGSGNLGIRLSETGPFGQTMYDAVRLETVGNSTPTVPEPATLTLLAIGGCGAGIYGSRKRLQGSA